MGLFLRSGTQYRSTSQAKLDLQSALPAKVFSLCFDQNRGEYYLDEIEPMPIPDKTYGDAERNAERIVATFMNRSSSTGVLLAGEKGSGKTLLAKMVCHSVQAVGMPVIVINHPWVGDAFNSFIQSIDQPCAVLFDEFEKVYDRNEKREALLTLLDGVYPSKKLFLLTANDKWAIDNNMRNRPGRIFYMIEFGGLDRDFVMNYAAENLCEPTDANGVVKASMLFPRFNFDMLKALVEEMNRYNEPATQALKFLNIKPDWEQGQAHQYTLTAEFKSEKGDDRKVTRRWSGNPLLTPIEFQIDDYENGENRYFEFDAADLKFVNSESGQIVYENEDGKVLIERVVSRNTFNWGAV